MVSFSDALYFRMGWGRVGTGRGETGTSARKAIASWCFKQGSLSGTPRRGARSTSNFLERGVPGWTGSETQSSASTPYI